MKRYRRRTPALSASLLSFGAFAAITTLTASGGALLPASARAQTPPATAAPPDPSSLPAPVGLWTLDEGTALTAADTSGHGYNGTLQGGVTWADTGVVGAHALRFGGNGNETTDPGVKAPASAGNGSVEIAKPVVDTSRSFTVAAWVKLAHIKPGDYQTFVSIDGNQVSGFFLQLRGDTGQLAFSVLPTDDSSVNTPAIAAAPFAPEAGEWYHIAGVYDATAQTISFYVDGALQQTVPFTTPWRANGHTAIGRGKFGGKPTDFANADIDDVRLYNTALGASDIETLTKQGMASPTLTVDAALPTGRVSPTLYGLMTEEINYSYDGGLYGELIRNRIFRDDPATPTHWSIVLPDDVSSGAIALDTSQPINSALTTALKLTVNMVGPAKRVGVANDGYWGIPIKPDTRYHASFYARAATADFKGPVTVTLESVDGATVYAKGDVGKISGVWKKYDLTLQTTKTAAPTTAARFVLSASSPGSVEFNLVSLFPPTYDNREGGNRVDLMEKMAAMKPAFLRMPGGNYLEGNTIPERFDWKRTIGPVEQRAGHQGPWGYRSTDGMGLLEFLRWCEELHMEPVLAVYAGYSLNGEHVAAGVPLQPFVQDALDEIEYVSGDKNTTWGARRAKDGHPDPFPLHYVEIGNEDGLDRSGSYDGRYAQFYDAIKGQYPNLQLIATTKVKARVPDVIDDHFYLLPRDMARQGQRYDHYSRTGPKVFVGEWASQTINRPWEHPAMSSGPTPDWNATLGDAAFMTGMERNSDIIVLESYAPLLVNVNPNARQWSQNLIGYDGLSSFGSPSYYAQALFATHVGDSLLHARLAGATGLYESVTQDSATGTIYVKLVNPSSSAQAVKIDLQDAKSIRAGQDATAISMVSSNLTDVNSLTEPTKIAPVTTTVTGAGANFTYTFPAYSITVLVVGGK